jgi:hypothetical protein
VPPVATALHVTAVPTVTGDAGVGVMLEIVGAPGPLTVKLELARNAS